MDERAHSSCHLTRLGDLHQFSTELEIYSMESAAVSMDDELKIKIKIKIKASYVKIYFIRYNQAIEKEQCLLGSGTMTWQSKNNKASSNGSMIIIVIGTMA